MRDDVVEFVRTGEFSRLENLATTYRDSQARTSSGLWKLTLFYSGIKSYLDMRRQDEWLWNAKEKNIRKWVSTYPSSATAHVAMAKYFIARGWGYRGGGFAHTVEEPNWKPFHDNVQKARDYLEKNKAVASSDPHWYELMGIIAYAQSWPETDFTNLMDEGLARHPRFYQLYFTAIDYYAPKWGGSAKSIELFARQAISRTQPVEGFGMYARVYWYASQSQYDERLFTDSLVNWDDMKIGIDNVVKSYPDAWNINNFAKFACLSKDKVKAAELIRRIDGPLMQDVWGAQDKFQRCKEWSLR